MTWKKGYFSYVNDFLGKERTETAHYWNIQW